MGKKIKKNEKKKSEKKEDNDDKKELNKDKDNNDNKNETFNDSEDLKYKDISKLLENDLTKNIVSNTDEIINNKDHKSNDSLYKNLQNNPINSILMEIVKEFMLTDLEIVYLSLYLDIYGWENKYFDIKDNLILTALSVKKYLNEDIDIIETHLSAIYENIEDKFANWIKSQKNKMNITITPRMVNERNNILKKPYNCYCRNNYIDYDDAVDKILHLSLSYNEINKHTNKIKSKNSTKQIIDFTKEENNK